MKKLHTLARASLLISAFALLSYAGDDQYVVRVPPSIAGAVAKQHGGKITKTIKQDEGVYLFSVPSAAGAALKANPLVQSVTANTKLTLPEVSAAPVPKPAWLRYYGGAPKLSGLPTGFRSYLNQ